MDEQEVVWLASAHLQERLGSEAQQWVHRPHVEARPMGWLVYFRNTGHYSPRNRPPDKCFYVFRDGFVELVSKHGPQFHESRRRRVECSLPESTEPNPSSTSPRETAEQRVQGDRCRRQ
jgi:hypothetical protein